MTYQQFLQYIVDLQKDGLELFNAGKSVLGQNILATHVGSYDGVQILIQGGIHAREYITSLLMVEQARYLHYTGSVRNGGIYFLFATNPDGIEIVLDGLTGIPCDITKEYLTRANGGSDDFSQYKANVNLVDLNTNFDAQWGSGAQNVRCPSTEDFIGFYPNSEREVLSLINFTNRVRPSLTISYHSKGEVIYYGFAGQSEPNLARDRQIGEVLSQVSGYALIPTENSAGGYKDWCIEKLSIPAYTIEVGRDVLPHPISIDYLGEIFQQNKDIPLTALNQAILYQNQIRFQEIQSSSSNKKAFNLFNIFK
ncbi:MAG: hypothetical protein J6A28_01975 [Clostridia bacterium]|nr:hypothetical protein [Clostridia bacterium]